MKYKRKKRFNIVRIILTGLMVAGLVFGMVYLYQTIRDLNEVSVVNPGPNLKESSSNPLVLETETTTVKQYFNYVSEGDLELPINQASGFASMQVEVYAQPHTDATVLTTYVPGEAFLIIKESGDYWYVENANAQGWVKHAFCFVNLPDVVPSIVYDHTNTYASQFKSSFKIIPEITDQALYSSKAYNDRLGREAYSVPVLYATAKKISKAQQVALSNGNSLTIYEAFRPYGVQAAVRDALSAMANQDPEVMKGITTPPWSIGWFIAAGVSNHQVGYAIDVSLVLVEKSSIRTAGDYQYTHVEAYTGYDMPTSIHELSTASAAFTQPFSSKLDLAWQTIPTAPSMNAPALELQFYCTQAGLIPLASEWWHFNDLDALRLLGDLMGNGDYYITEILSEVPRADE